MPSGFGKWRTFCNHINGNNSKCYAASRDKANRKAFSHIGDIRLFHCILFNKSKDVHSLRPGRLFPSRFNI